MKKIEKLWISRIKACGEPIKGKRYQTNEVNYFIGAMAAMSVIAPDIELPVYWAILLGSGRAICSEERHKNSEKEKEETND